MSWWQKSYLGRKIKDAWQATKKVWDEVFAKSESGEISEDDAIVEFLTEVTDTNFEEAKKAYEKKLDKLSKKSQRIVDDLSNKIEEIVSPDFEPAKYTPEPVEAVAEDNPLRLGLKWHQCGLDVHASTNVFAFAYDYGFNNLHIIFLNLKEEEAFLSWFPANALGYVYPRYYIFQNIDEKAFNEFRGAESYGEWVWENIRRNSEYNDEWIIDIWTPRTVNPVGNVNDPKSAM